MMIGAFFLVLGPLVLLHELGHYLAGRLCGVRAAAFSIGFGRELVGWTDKRGTRWKLCAIPAGGYVQFAGDLDASSRPDPALADASDEDRKGTFPAAPLWQRAFIVFAGPLMNLLVAVAIFATFNMTYGVGAASNEIGAFSPNSAAAAAGLKVGDKVVAVDSAKADDFADIAQNVALYPGKTVMITALRDGRSFQVPVTLATDVIKDRFGNEMRRGLLGIQSKGVRYERQPPLRAISMAFGQCWGAMRTMAIGLKQIVVGERSVKEMGGPIKIAKYSGEQLSLGWPEFVGFAALISINLAFINLLPIPVLDGGHLAMYAAEAVRRRPLGERSQEWAFRTGLAFVLAIMLFVTLNDLASLPLFGR